MLPPELLKVIFGALSRDDLDALMLANGLLCDIVLRDFSKEPFRYADSLNIYQGYMLIFTTDMHRFEDNDELNRRMRLMRVGGIR